MLAPRSPEIVEREMLSPILASHRSQFLPSSFYPVSHRPRRPIHEHLVSPDVGPEFFETRANLGGEAELEELLDYEITTSVIQSRE